MNKASRSLIPPHSGVEGNKFKQNRGHYQKLESCGAQTTPREYTCDASERRAKQARPAEETAKGKEQRENN